jgi:hypothetical protein
VAFLLSNGKREGTASALRSTNPQITGAKEFFMQNAQELLTEQAEASAHTITVRVNERPVVFHQHKATGAEIKATAIAQGVSIQPDFNLFEETGHGKLKPVGDNDPVALHQHQEFVATAPDDNS